jgi:hypothetical protein
MKHFIEEPRTGEKGEYEEEEFFLVGEGLGEVDVWEAVEYEAAISAYESVGFTRRGALAGDFLTAGGWTFPLGGGRTAGGTGGFVGVREGRAEEAEVEVGVGAGAEAVLARRAAFVGFRVTCLMGFHIWATRGLELVVTLRETFPVGRFEGGVGVLAKVSGSSGGEGTGAALVGEGEGRVGGEVGAETRVGVRAGDRDSDKESSNRRDEEEMSREMEESVK